MIGIFFNEISGLYGKFRKILSRTIEPILIGKKYVIGLDGTVLE